ncbi:hypothetical protein LPB03_06355 [Polaribacter vadi]|nr:hypothetical protein LPB03_06355 [Polaribacter vadi]
MIVAKVKNLIFFMELILNLFSIIINEFKIGFVMQAINYINWGIFNNYWGTLIELGDLYYFVFHCIHYQTYYIFYF